MSLGLYGGSLPESGGLSGKCDGVVANAWLDVAVDVNNGPAVVFDVHAVETIAIDIELKLAAVPTCEAGKIPFPLTLPCMNDSNWPKSSASLSMPPIKSARPV